MKQKATLKLESGKDILAEIEDCTWYGEELSDRSPTSKEAEDAKRAKFLIQTVSFLREKYNGFWKVDFEDEDQKKFLIAYSGDRDRLMVLEAVSIYTGSPFGYFRDIESAEHVMETYRDELEWYFTEYILGVN